MAEALSKVAGVLPIALPPFVNSNSLTDDHIKTFLSISDAMLAGIVPQSEKPGENQIAVDAATYESDIKALEEAVPGTDRAVVKKMLAEYPSAIPEFRALTERAFNIYISQSTLASVKALLVLLNTRVGCYFLVGKTTLFRDMPLNERVAAVQGWGDSRLTLIRMAAKSFGTIVKNFYIKTSPLLYPAIQHPVYYEQQEVGKSFDFKFEEFKQSAEEAYMETDVVIVGSGCGAGVVAKNLTEAGHKIIVVEKSTYFKPETLPMHDLPASIHLYEAGQIIPSEDGSIAGVYAGSTWGGGGAVNWSACLQTQGFVRKEWASKGLPMFESAEFQQSMDRVWKTMGVQYDKTEHNHGNRVLLEGARQLGYAAKDVAQNSGNTKHYCGYCGHGCRSAEKNGPHNLWLPAAARTGNARFVQSYQVDKVVFEKRNGKKQAIGVTGTWSKINEKYETVFTRKLFIRANKVIISAGSLNSPILLMNSGFNQYNVGRNLYLHPATHVFGIFKEVVKPCEGGILTSVVTEFERQDSNWGVKLEACSMLPSNSLSLAPWNSPEQWKHLSLRHRHMNAYIVLARDRDSGRVERDPKSGRPKVVYSVSDYDKNHVLEGIIAMAKILFNQGALEIHTGTSGAKPYIRSRNVSQEQVDREFGEWQAHIRTLGLPYPAATFASAHQMGTCRMGTGAAESVVDPKCKVWGAEDLYVMDASVFPSASGVNPMITNMGIADWASRELIKTMKAGK